MRRNPTAPLPAISSVSSFRSRTEIRITSRHDAGARQVAREVDTVLVAKLDVDQGDVGPERLRRSRSASSPDDARPTTADALHREQPRGRGEELLAVVDDADSSRSLSQSAQSRGRRGNPASTTGPGLPAGRPAGPLAAQTRHAANCAVHPRAHGQGRDSWPDAARRRVSLAQIEVRSIDHSPADERHGAVRDQFTLVVRPQRQHLPRRARRRAGVHGPGLPLGLHRDRRSASSSALLLVGFHAIQGPRLGVPQMIQSRGQFGFYGAVLVFAASIVLDFGFLAAQLVIQADAMNLLISSVSIPAWIAILTVPGGRPHHLRLRLDPPLAAVDDRASWGSRSRSYSSRRSLHGGPAGARGRHPRHRRSRCSWAPPACS